MTTATKIILIIVVFFVGIMLTFIVAPTGNNLGPLGLVIVFALFAAVRAIWKYKPETSSNNSEVQKKEDDKHTLDKH